MANCTDSLCSGDFYDSGSNTGNYGNNENLVHTICSDNGNCMQVDFTSFDIEAGFDFLVIYDGPNTSSPIVGNYTGTNNPGIITGTGGCLTFEFISDASVTGPGWEATINCVTCTGGPA